MTPLRQRMIHDLKIRNYSPRSVECYVRHVACFARHFGRSPEVLGPEEVRQYQVYLIEEKRPSWSGFNQAVCALRFFYRFTLPRPWHVTMIPFAKRPRRLPTVLGLEEVQRLLSCTRPLKHRVILTVLYAAGLRLQEALDLTAADIDSGRMLLRVACGKGAKERLVPMSQRLLDTLRDYWRAARPQVWLFPGQGAAPLHGASVQRSCRRAAAEAGISKRVTPHVLRHSYATGLLEAGVDVLTIGRLLGHRALSSTLIYLHVRRPHLESVPSPLDWLPVAQCPQWAPAEHPGPAPVASGAPRRRNRPDRASASPTSSAPTDPPCLPAAGSRRRSRRR